MLELDGPSEAYLELTNAAMEHPRKRRSYPYSDFLSSTTADYRPRDTDHYISADPVRKGT